MQAFVLISFLVIFALVVLSVSMGLRFLEAQRKKKVAQILQSGGTEAAASEALLLVERSDSQALEQLLERFNFAKKLEANIQQGGLDWTVGRLLMMMAGLSVVGALLGLRFAILISPTITALAGAALFGMAPYLYVVRTRNKRMSEFEAEFPEALDFLARAMRAGHAFSISLEMLSDESPEPLRTEFRKVFNEQNLGAPVEVALQNLAVRVPLLDVRFFVSSVLLQKETGGNLSEILTKLAHVIRERFRLKGQVKAASAHGRITGTILTLMPVVLMLGLLVVAPGYLQGMAADPDGKYLIGGALVGQALGHYFIRRIINIKV